MMQRVLTWMCLLLVFTIPWENMVELGGVGRISRLTGLLLAAAWIAAVAARGELRRPGVFHVVAFLFVEWNALSYFWTVDPEATAERLSTYVQLFVLVFILWDTITTRESLDLALEAYVLGAWVTALSLAGNYVLHGGREYQERFTTGSFQLDDVSLILALGLPPAWYLAVHGRARLLRALRWVNFLYAPLAIVAIVLTGSRTAVVSLVVSLGYALATLTRLRPRARVAALALLVGLVLASLPLVPAGTIERLRETGREATEGSVSGRLLIWREAVTTFEEHPWLGVGSGAFRGADSRHVPHNFALGFLSELGVVGFLLFMVLFSVTAVSALRQPAGLPGLWASVLATWLIGASLYNFGEKKQTWLFFSLVACGAGLLETGRPPGWQAAGEPHAVAAPAGTP